MNLIYRGNTYNYDATKTASRPFQQVRESGSAYELCYRGVKYHVNPNAKPAKVHVPAAYKLIYRGITYLVNKTAQGVTTIIQPTNKF